MLTGGQDNDGALNQEELEQLFSTSPGNPWLSQRFPDTTEVDEKGNEKWPRGDKEVWEAGTRGIDKGTFPPGQSREQG